MAAEAEAAREARAKVNKQLSDESFQKYLENISIIFSKVIAAEGEQKASRALREASNTIAESSSALQLRYLQVTFLVVVVVGVVVVMFASKDYFYEDDFSDLEFYISREEFDDNISNTFRYNVKFYEVSIIEPLTGVIVFIKLT